MGDGEEGEQVLDEAATRAMRSTPEFRRLIEKVKKLQAMRHGVIKRYFDKHKYKKNHRNDIIRSAEESEHAF